MERLLLRRFAVFVMSVSLAMAFLAVSGPGHPVAAEVSPPTTCEGQTYPTSTITLNPLSSVSFGLTARACTDGRISWNWSSSYPANCWVSYPRVLVVTGVCGYAGNLTSSFRYIEKVTMYNYSGLVIKLGLSLISGLPAVVLPDGYKFPCTVVFTYSPSTVSHGWTGSASGSCGPMSPIY